MITRVSRITEVVIQGKGGSCFYLVDSTGPMQTGFILYNRNIFLVRRYKKVPPSTPPPPQNNPREKLLGHLILSSLSIGISHSR